MNFKPLEPKIIKDCIRDIINEDIASLVLTLIEGDLLFGDFSYVFRSFTGTPEEAEQAGLWMPDEEETLFPGEHTAYQLLPVTIVFNDKEGTRHGSAHEVRVRDNLISGIRPLAWTKESTSNNVLKNVPNPIATLVYNHNTAVASRYKLDVIKFVEYALAESGVPPSGIEFSSDELIYADWDFFSHMSSGPISIGVFGFSLGGGRSLSRFAQDKLIGGTVEKIGSIILSMRTLKECRVEGFLVTPKAEVATIIEGHECMAVICCEKKHFPPDGKFLPVLLKKKFLSYPIEFLPFLNSRLVFYGDIKQIPLELSGVTSDIVLLARAIGYLTSE